MLPPCPVDASDPTVDIVVPSLEAPTLADAVAEQAAVIWVRSDPASAFGLPVTIERDVAICGPQGRADIPDVHVEAGTVLLERVVLRSGGGPALDVTGGTVEIVDSAIEHVRSGRSG